MTDVLVIGAGPTGLTLACLLRASGIDVSVVDRLARPAGLAKAMVVWSRSLEILERIGIGRAAVAAGVGLERALYLQGPRLLASVRTNRVPSTRWQPLILPQEILERLLLERLQALGGDVDWGRQATTIAEDADAVEATMVRADGSTERRRAAYVVGCDGLRSVVRTAAGIGWRDRAPYEEVFQLGDVTADTSLDANTVYQFLGR
jgi:2-polyprenyl-6-methoxyphenol hydroxylase-like FAD-dependent oxidoreductase